MPASCLNTVAKYCALQNLRRSAVDTMLRPASRSFIAAPVTKLLHDTFSARLGDKATFAPAATPVAGSAITAAENHRTQPYRNIAM